MFKYSKKIIIALMVAVMALTSVPTSAYAKPCKHSYTVVSTTKATTKSNGNKIKQCKKCKEMVTETTYKPVVSISSSKFTYNGKVQKPTVSVKNSQGKDINKSSYKVSYSNKDSQGSGIYTVTVKFKSRWYSGEKKLTYKILPQPTSVKSLKSGDKQITVNIKSQKKSTTGYKVMYSTDKKFKKDCKTYVVKSNKNKSVTLKDLKKSTTYYVKVRTYKTTGDKTVNSRWSKAKSVKTNVTYCNVGDKTADGKYEVVYVVKGGGNAYTNKPVYTYEFYDKYNGKFIQSKETDADCENLAEYKSLLKKTHDELAKKLPKNPTELQIVALIDVYFAENVEYAFKKDGKTPDDKYNSGYHALKYGKAICSGQASLFKDLCTSFNILSYWVGLNRSKSSAGHAINYVVIDGYIYSIDVTNYGGVSSYDGVHTQIRICSLQNDNAFSKHLESPYYPDKGYKGLYECAYFKIPNDKKTQKTNIEMDDFLNERFGSELVEYY